MHEINMKAEKWWRKTRPMKDRNMSNKQDSKLKLINRIMVQFQSLESKEDQFLRQALADSSFFRIFIHGESLIIVWKAFQ